MIPTLSSNAFAGQLRAPASKGASPIFRGKIKIGDQSIHCYIKPLPDMIEVGGQALENREIVSEALGYILAKKAGYSVAENAGIINLRLDQIPADVLAQLQAATPKGAPQNDYLAWFSQDMQHPSLLKRHITDAPEHMQQLQLRRLALHLANHPHAPSLITFDEWTENSDRNLGNLLEAVDGALSLIDHGRLFRLPIWKPSRLATSGLPMRNVIRELIDTHTPHWSERTPTKSARTMAYNKLSMTWRSDGAAAAQRVLADFLDDQEATLVIDFLAMRLEPAHFNKVVGILV